VDAKVNDMGLGTLVWRGQAFMAAVEKKVKANLDSAAIMVVNDIVGSFGSGTGTYGKGPVQRSKEGEPPYVQTGDLKRSISFDAPSALVRRVGSRMKPGDKDNPNSGKHTYAWYLEMGTAYMGERPYLMPAVRRNRSKVLAMIAKGS
jgi:hypothetical protein